MIIRRSITEEVIPLEPTTISQWSSWSSCSVSCGEGRQSRQRQCQQGTVTEYDGYKAVKCSTYELGENIVCNLRNCKRSNSTLIYIKNQYITVNANDVDRVPQSLEDCDNWSYSITIREETTQLDMNECISVYQQMQRIHTKSKPEFKPPSIKSTTKPTTT